MMGFTADGRHDPARVAERDKRWGVSSEARKKARSDIQVPATDPGADAWQNGNVVQLADPTGTGHAAESRARPKDREPTASPPAPDR